MQVRAFGRYLLVTPDWASRGVRVGFRSVTSLDARLSDATNLWGMLWTERSRMIAMPWPPPTTWFLARIACHGTSSELISVLVIRAPVIPNRMPERNGATVLMLTLSSSIPSSRMEAMDLGSERLVDLDQVDVAVDVEGWPVAMLAYLLQTGPSPMISGDNPATPVLTMRAE